MARRTITMLLGAAFTLLVAAPAEATLVYVKDAGGADTRVWVADDDGTQARTGSAPATRRRSRPDGRWVAWIQAGVAGPVDDAARRPQSQGARGRPLVGHRRPAVLAGLEVGSGWWSAGGCSSTTSASATRSRRRPASIRGFSFSPDSASVVFGTAGSNDAADAPSDLYSVPLEDEVRPDHARPQVAQPAVGAGRDHSRPDARRGRRRPDVQRVHDQARRREPAQDHDAAHPGPDERSGAARAVRQRRAAAGASSSARTRRWRSASIP